MRPAAWALLALVLAGCSPAHGAEQVPRHLRRAGPAIAVQAQSLPLDPRDPARERIGDFAYAGGLVLTSEDTTRLHGLSDLKVWPDGRLLSVSDEGDVLQARLVLDAAGRLVGLAHATLRPLLGDDGQPLSAHGKDEADSEGIAQFPGGGRLVSLEHDHRILFYPPDGGPPRRAPAPPEHFLPDLGMEALTLDPAAGPDAYLVGAELSGRIWLCRLAGRCDEQKAVAKPALWGLSGMDLLPGGGRAYLLRALDKWFGWRARLRLVGADGRTLDELKLAAPLTADNFEGVAAVPRDDGRVRLYLISDDNFSPGQRTLLLAFDWSPTTPRTAP